MNKKRARRIAILLLCIFAFAAVPFFCQHAQAQAQSSYRPRGRIVIRYRITWKRKKVKKKKAKPKLSNKKVTTTAGEITEIELSNATAKKIKWSSSKKSVATVKKDGSTCIITAKKPGKAIITAKYKGKKYKCKLTVKNKKAAAFTCSDVANGGTITFVKTNPYMDEFDSSFKSIYFNETVYPVTLSYHETNASVAECEWDFDYSGFKLDIHPKEVGTTWITISNSYNSQIMKFRIDVKAGYMEVLNSDIILNDFAQEAVIKLRCPDDVQTVYYNTDWDSSFEVSRTDYKDGLFLFYIRPLKNGKSFLTFEDRDGRYRMELAAVTVSVPNKSITSDYDELNMVVGDTSYLEIYTDNGTPISLEADNDNISCTRTGNSDNRTLNYKIYAKKEGQTIITVRDSINASLVKTVVVNVRSVEVTGIKITTKPSVINAVIMSNRIYGNVTQFKATVYPENATCKDVIWESTDPSVAEVDKNGYVTGKKNGTTIIRASTPNGYSDEAQLKVYVTSYN